MVMVSDFLLAKKMVMVSKLAQTMGAVCLCAHRECSVKSCTAVPPGPPLFM